MGGPAAIAAMKNIKVAPLYVYKFTPLTFTASSNRIPFRQNFIYTDNMSEFGTGRK
jgi:hypothetical protein